MTFRDSREPQKSAREPQSVAENQRCGIKRKGVTNGPVSAGGSGPSWSGKECVLRLALQEPAAMFFKADFRGKFEIKFSTPYQHTLTINPHPILSGHGTGSMQKTLKTRSIGSNLDSTNDDVPEF